MKPIGYILLAMLFLASACISSWITLYAINQLFSSSIEISFLNVMALTWLVLVIKGILINNITVQR